MFIREALIRRGHHAATLIQRGATGETGPRAGLRVSWDRPETESKGEEAEVVRDARSPGVLVESLIAEATEVRRRPADKPDDPEHLIQY